MAEKQRKIFIEDGDRITLAPSDGAIIFIWRGEDEIPEVIVPQLGRLTPGRIEKHQMLLYRGIMEQQEKETRHVEEVERKLQAARRAEVNAARNAR